VTLDSCRADGTRNLDSWAFHPKKSSRVTPRLSKCRNVRPVTQILLGTLLGGVAAVLLSSEVQLERISAALPGARGPLLVVVVDDPSAVAAVRAAIREERIVVERPGGLALAEGRVIAAGHAVASELINAAGWSGREIQMGLSTPPAKERRASAAVGLTGDRIAWILRGCVILGGLLAVLGLRNLWRRTLARRRQAAFLRSSQPPILVLRMADRAGLRAVRVAMPAARVLAESHEAFALEGGWIVTCNDGAASQLLAAAGWKDRVLATHHPDPFGSAARRDDWGALAGELELDAPTAKSLWSTREAILALRGEGGSPDLLSDAPTREPLELPSAKPDAVLC